MGGRVPESTLSGLVSSTLSLVICRFGACPRYTFKFYTLLRCAYGPLLGGRGGGQLPRRPPVEWRPPTRWFRSLRFYTLSCSRGSGPSDSTLCGRRKVLEASIRPREDPVSDLVVCFGVLGGFVGRWGLERTPGAQVAHAGTQEGPHGFKWLFRSSFTGVVFSIHARTGYACPSGASQNFLCIAVRAAKSRPCFRVSSTEIGQASIAEQSLCLLVGSPPLCMRAGEL